MVEIWVDIVTCGGMGRVNGLFIPIGGLAIWASQRNH